MTIKFAAIKQTLTSQVETTLEDVANAFDIDDWNTFTRLPEERNRKFASGTSGGVGGEFYIDLNRLEADVGVHEVDAALAEFQDSAYESAKHLFDTGPLFSDDREDLSKLCGDLAGEVYREHIYDIVCETLGSFEVTIRLGVFFYDGENHLYRDIEAPVVKTFCNIIYPKSFKDPSDVTYSFHREVRRIDTFGFSNLFEDVLDMF